MLTRNDFLKKMSMACVMLGHADCLVADGLFGRQRFVDDWDYLKRKWREPCANPATGLEREEFRKAVEALVAARKDIEPWPFVKAVVAACVGYNPVKTKIADARSRGSGAAMRSRSTTWDRTGHSANFLKRMAGFLPKKFPRAGARSVRRCRAFVWELPRPDLLKAAA